ncbi:hypothetical protein CAI21_20800 [Alkalilimnicola ehrlichii]|uniref:Biopolymer transporter ExbD n=1 Tax=Alkalilimnicola ehrlichii TaxID=351052 RepID=A0A3E0WP86_9GAMM|nr:biopolymer transporter ExbD [Alkalilimnicola ehrlichii]RFA24657.1 hypothetical protein CAI21_20800 [Alkalilimnicola ehrlichii]RFA33765.1 hypothetical protein CAL65_16620 [Alkalilimnicola ehrlichii]
MRIEVPARRRNLISLTPLIDVVFILLVFFMLASSFLDWRGISLNMPPVSEVGRVHDGSLELRLGVDGSVSLDGEAVSRDAALRRVGAAVSTEPDRLVIVRPEGEVRLQTMVEWLEALSGAGATNVSLRQG